MIQIFITKKAEKAKQMVAWVLLLSMFFVGAFSLLSTVNAYADPPAERGASGKEYDSWTERWATGDTYNGLSDFSDDGDPNSIMEEKDNWIASLFQQNTASVIRYLVGTLFIWIFDSLEISLEKIVYGRVAVKSTGTTTQRNNKYQFGLHDGNLYGSVGSIMYAIFRNFIFAVFAVQFMWILGSFLLKGTGKGRADLKTAIYNFIFLFTMLFAMPLIVDIILYLRDTILKVFATYTAAAAGSTHLGVTYVILTNAENDKTIVGSILLLFALGSTLHFLVSYIKIAIQQAYLFGVFPIVAFRSFSDRAILNKWIGQFITENAARDNGSAVALIALIVFMSIIPCRNAIMQLFGMPIPGRGFSLAAAAMMMARMASRSKGGEGGNGAEETKNKSAEGGGGRPITDTNSGNSSSTDLEDKGKNANADLNDNNTNPEQTNSRNDTDIETAAENNDNISDDNDTIPEGTEPVESNGEFQKTDDDGQIIEGDNANPNVPDSVVAGPGAGDGPDGTIQQVDSTEPVSPDAGTTVSPNATETPETETSLTDGQGSMPSYEQIDSPTSSASAHAEASSDGISDEELDKILNGDNAEESGDIDNENNEDNTGTSMEGNDGTSEKELTDIDQQAEGGDTNDAADDSDGPVENTDGKEPEPIEADTETDIHGTQDDVSPKPDDGGSALQGQEQPLGDATKAGTGSASEAGTTLPGTEQGGTKSGQSPSAGAGDMQGAKGSADGLGSEAGGDSKSGRPTGGAPEHSGTERAKGSSGDGIGSGGGEGRADGTGAERAQGSKPSGGGIEDTKSPDEVAREEKSNHAKERLANMMGGVQNTASSIGHFVRDDVAPIVRKGAALTGSPMTADGKWDYKTEFANASRTLGKVAGALGTVAGVSTAAITGDANAMLAAGMGGNIVGKKIKDGGAKVVTKAGEGVSRVATTVNDKVIQPKVVDRAATFINQNSSTYQVGGEAGNRHLYVGNEVTKMRHAAETAANKSTAAAAASSAASATNTSSNAANSNPSDEEMRRRGEAARKAVLEKKVETTGAGQGGASAFQKQSERERGEQAKKDVMGRPAGGNGASASDEKMKAQREATAKALEERERKAAEKQEYRQKNEDVGNRLFGMNAKDVVDAGSDRKCEFDLKKAGLDKKQQMDIRNIVAKQWGKEGTGALKEYKDDKGKSYYKPSRKQLQMATQAYCEEHGIAFDGTKISSGDGSK